MAGCDKPRLTKRRISGVTNWLAEKKKRRVRECVAGETRRETGGIRKRFGLGHLENPSFASCVYV